MQHIKSFTTRWPRGPFLNPLSFKATFHIMREEGNMHTSKHRTTFPICFNQDGWWGDNFVLELEAAKLIHKLWWTADKVYGREEKREFLSVNEAISVGPNLIWLLSPYKKEIWIHRDIGDAHVHRGKATWEHSRKAAIWKPRKEASKETKPADTLIWALPASRTMRKQVYVV